ncbi:MAG: SDR family NAD(P)-dependent oxidoreductase [Salinibacterium sp.]|nr:SDR family NAD(P)-dependent oxidoreductase [Salinibacterium sp.]
MATALITGGTSGIGAAFASALAERGYALVLVARNEERLGSSAKALHAAFGIEVETIRADLAERADVDRVVARLEDSERPIELLINCAGFGVRTRLIDELEVHEKAFAVMVHAIMILSGAAGRAMSRRGAGSIINISSLQSFLTTGSYAAIKAWVTSYTQALATELRPAGVRVTAVLPGWVRTEWHERAGVERSSLPSWLWVEPELVVRVALRDSAGGRVVSIPSVRYRVLGWFARHLPMAIVRLISARLSSSRPSPTPSTSAGALTPTASEAAEHSPVTKDPR